METTETILQAEKFIKDSLKQAHLEAPWRKQVQFAALFLALLIGIAMLTWIYLSVSSEAVKAGREIQIMRSFNKHIQQVNADLEAQYAFLISAAVMNERVKSMNLEPINPEALIYLTVPGYQSESVRLGAPSNSIAIVQPKTDTPLMGPQYSQSWIDWLFQKSQEMQPLFRVVKENQP